MRVFFKTKTKAKNCIKNRDAFDKHYWVFISPKLTASTYVIIDHNKKKFGGTILYLNFLKNKKNTFCMFFDFYTLKKYLKHFSLTHYPILPSNDAWEIVFDQNTFLRLKPNSCYPSGFSQKRKWNGIKEIFKVINANAHTCKIFLIAYKMDLLCCPWFQFCCIFQFDVYFSKMNVLQN